MMEEETSRSNLFGSLCSHLPLGDPAIHILCGKSLLGFTARKDPGRATGVRPSYNTMMAFPYGFGSWNGASIKSTLQGGPNSGIC